MSSRPTRHRRSAPQAAARSAACGPAGAAPRRARRVRRSAATSARRAVRPEPLRGRNPSKTNRPAGRPLTTRAVTAADGPGTTSTACPASTAARTSRSPGSEMPGMPASVTTATRSPAASRSSTPPMARCLGVVVDHDERASVHPGVLQQPPGAPGVLAADGVGVAERLDGARRQVAQVADRRADEHERHRVSPAARAGRRRARSQRANEPASASSTAWARSTGRVSRWRARRAIRSTTRSRVAPRHVERRTACRACAPTGPARRSRAPSMPSRPSSPLRRAARVSATSRLASTSPSRSSHAMGSTLGRQTLKRISSTSPSATT